MDPDQPTVLLYRAADATHAALISQALEARGIPTTQAGGNTSSIAFGELGADALLVDIWVPTELAEEGRRVVERLQKRAAAGPRPDWRCVCGEANDAGFELCWSCRTQRPAS